jgi:hypothetical protein
LKRHLGDASLVGGASLMNVSETASNGWVPSLVELGKQDYEKYQLLLDYSLWVYDRGELSRYSLF